ncbi:UNVERIFIED_CONTAM: hypothetical protein FKN15_058335 [Acipenser sinensis]
MRRRHAGTSVPSLTPATWLMFTLFKLQKSKQRLQVGILKTHDIYALQVLHA